MSSLNVHFSSKTDQWATPLDFFNIWDEKYNFNLDAAADDSNAKCTKYYTKEDDGLHQPWEGVVWCNPPYGRQIGEWIKKGYEESLKGSVVVMLIPSRTDTKYWHDYVMKGDITFIKGRLKFGGSKNSAPFPSAVVVFGEEG